MALNMAQYTWYTDSLLSPLNVAAVVGVTADGDFVEGEAEDAIELADGVGDAHAGGIGDLGEGLW